MAKPEKESELSQAALALDHELRRFEELAAQAAQVRLNSEKGLERATDALTRAAESQDRIRAHVQKLVAAVAASRQRQEDDAAALMERAKQISARRAEFAEVLQAMAALGQMAKEVQEHLKGGGDVASIQEKMDEIARRAAQISETAAAREMEDLARQAEVLRQQVLSARNKIGLLAKKPSA